MASSRRRTFAMCSNALRITRSTASTSCCRGQSPARSGLPARNAWLLDTAGAGTGTIMAHAHEPEDRRLAHGDKLGAIPAQLGDRAAAGRSTAHRAGAQRLAPGAAGAVLQLV